MEEKRHTRVRGYPVLRIGHTLRPWMPAYAGMMAWTAANVSAATRCVCALGIGLALFPVAAQALCDLTLIAEVPVIIGGQRGLRPVVKAAINGVEGNFLFDTGAGSSLLWRASLSKFGISTETATPVRMKSFGRWFDTVTVTAGDVTFAGWSRHDVRLVVVDDALTSNTDGAIGESEFGGADMEIDLPHKAVRFFSPSDCRPDELAYWARSAPVHSIDIEPLGPESNRIFGPVVINSVRFRALFDTGAPTTALTATTAEAAGVRGDSPGVVENGVSRGVGPAQLRTWTGHFSSFTIGDETIANPVFDFTEKPNASADILIGADFFLRHRVYVAKRQHVMALTDEGVDSFGIDRSAVNAGTGNTGPTR